MVSWPGTSRRTTSANRDGPSTASRVRSPDRAANTAEGQVDTHTPVSRGGHPVSIGCSGEVIGREGSQCRSLVRNLVPIQQWNKPTQGGETDGSLDELYARTKAPSSLGSTKRRPTAQSITENRRVLRPTRPLSRRNDHRVRTLTDSSTPVLGYQPDTKRVVHGAPSRPPPERGEPESSFRTDVRDSGIDSSNTLESPDLPRRPRMRDAHVLHGLAPRKRRRQLRLLSEGRAGRT